MIANSVIRAFNHAADGKTEMTTRSIKDWKRPWRW